MRAVLFDLDETLLDRSASLNRFIRWQALGMLRSSITDPDAFCTRFIELDERGMVWKDRVYAQLIDEFSIQGWTTEELLRSYELCFSGFCIAKAGALEAVHKLVKRGLKLGLVSNGFSPFQERNFYSLGVSHLFDSVVVSAAVGCKKPQKEIFHVACDQMGVVPGDVVFVGDNPIADIEGAASCGMYTVFIPSLAFPECDHADATCERFSDLPDIVENSEQVRR